MAIHIQRVVTGEDSCLQIEYEGDTDVTVEIRLMIGTEGNWIIERVTTDPQVDVLLGNQEG